MYQISSNEMLNTLISNIEQTVTTAKEKLATSVNATITETYWQIGGHAPLSYYQRSIQTVAPCLRQTHDLLSYIGTYAGRHTGNTDRKSTRLNSSHT